MAVRRTYGAAGGTSGDFVLGMNRWVLRVAGYAGLMTDRYPPFRLDMGGRDPGTLTLPPAGGPAPADLRGAADLGQAPPPGQPGGWTGGRIVSAVAGAVLVLCSAGLLGGSGVALWAQASRHDGYADLGTATYSVPGYAVASDTIGLHLSAGLVSDLVRVTAVNRRQGGTSTGNVDACLRGRDASGGQARQPGTLVRTPGGGPVKS